MTSIDDIKSSREIWEAVTCGSEEDWEVIDGPFILDKGRWSFTQEWVLRCISTNDVYLVWEDVTATEYQECSYNLIFFHAKKETREVWVIDRSKKNDNL